MQHALEAPTKELLSRDWEDIFAVLAKLREIYAKEPESFRNALQANPQFARAVFQAQAEAGIATFGGEHTSNQGG